MVVIAAQFSTFKEKSKQTEEAEWIIKDAMDKLQEELSDHYHQEVKIITKLTNEKE